MRKALVILAGLVVLAAINWTIAARERLLVDGRVVLLELAPVDPRSLLQGDYMALRYRMEREAFGGPVAGHVNDGYVVVRLAEDGIAAFSRFDDATPLAPDEVRLRYRMRNRAPQFATNAFFFEEGQGRAFATARYGEFRVGGDGEAILTGLRDGRLDPLPASAPR